MKAVVALFLFVAYLSGCAKTGSTHRNDRLDSERSVTDDSGSTQPLTTNDHSSPPLDNDSDPAFQPTDPDLGLSSFSQNPDNSQFRQHRIRANHNRSTTEEEILARIAPRLSRSTADLPVTHGADGHVRIDLKRRFSHVSLAKRMPDGTIRHTCVDNIKSAKAWLSSDERPKQR